jgi:hypothetical protein
VVTPLDSGDNRRSCPEEPRESGLGEMPVQSKPDQFTRDVFGEGEPLEFIPKLSVVLRILRDGSGVAAPDGTGFLRVGHDLSMLAEVRSVRRRIQLRSVAADGSGSARDRIHPALEVRPAILGGDHIGVRKTTCVFLEDVKEHNEVMRAPIEDSVQVASIVAPKLTKLAADLRAVREGKGSVVDAESVEARDLHGDPCSRLGWQSVKPLPDRLAAGGVSVVDGLEKSKLISHSQ